MRLNQLVAKVFNGDVAESDSRPVSDICRVSFLLIVVNLIILQILNYSLIFVTYAFCALSVPFLFACARRSIIVSFSVIL